MIDEPIDPNEDDQIPDDTPEWARDLTPQPRRDPELPRPTQPASAPQPAPVPQPQLTRQEREFREVTSWFSNMPPGHHLVPIGAKLRADAEQFVAWTNRMGEPAGADWGAQQREYAAHERQKLRGRAAELRFEIQAKIPGGLEKTLDRIFGPECRGQYGELTTIQAREELGI